MSSRFVSALAGIFSFGQGSKRTISRLIGSPTPIPWVATTTALSPGGACSGAGLFSTCMMPIMATRPHPRASGEERLTWIA